jgi:adenylate cyclase
LSADSSITARKSVHPGAILKIGTNSYVVEKQHSGSLFRGNGDNTAIETLHLKSEIKKEVTVMFTDIVGYSTYTSKYGDAASSNLLHKHNELLFPVVGEFGGHFVKTIGDSIMAYFDEPDSAVYTAMKMQKVLSEYNANVPVQHKIKIRIGMNTGIGMLEDNDVYGDVVNMAARVESLTDGDEIRISASTYSAIENKVNVTISSLGMRKLKGKEEMIEIFDVIWDG